MVTREGADALLEAGKRKAGLKELRALAEENATLQQKVDDLEARLGALESRVDTGASPSRVLRPADRSTLARA